jgi:hypothetical protein
MISWINSYKGIKTGISERGYSGISIDAKIFP